MEAKTNDLKIQQPMRIITTSQAKIKIWENPFKWDGSYLGSFKGVDITLESTGGDNDHAMWLKINNHKTFVIKCGGNNASCIYDELKPIFGLEKTGTHSIKIDSKIWILYRCNTINDSFVPDENITENQLAMRAKYDLETKLRQFLAFRFLFGVTPNTVKSIKIRRTAQNFYYLVSFNDNFSIKRMQKQGTGFNYESAISDANVKRYFEDITVTDALKEMLYEDYKNNKEIDNITEITYRLREQVREVVQRIDKESYWISDYIYKAISDSLDAE